MRDMNSFILAFSKLDRYLGVPGKNCQNRRYYQRLPQLNHPQFGFFGNFGISGNGHLLVSHILSQAADSENSCILLNMSKRDHACALLRQGNSPSQIAAKMGVRTSYVMNYLWSKIGEGDLRRSDIAFSLQRNVRRAIETVVAETKSQSIGRICQELQKRGIQVSRYDVSMYLEYRRAPVVLGDMYEIVRDIEVRLHRFIKRVFVSEFGQEDWWRGGVPDHIRAECAALREKDPEPAPEPYN